jgi:hypothetical protein
MKLTYITITTALLLSITGLLGEQTVAVANQESLILDHLYRDLVPTTPSQDFFQQGQQKIEREILLLEQGQNTASTEPLLKINADTQTEIDGLPQLQPGDLQQTILKIGNGE